MRSAVNSIIILGFFTLIGIKYYRSLPDKPINIVCSGMVTHLHHSSPQRIERREENCFCTQLVDSSSEKLTYASCSFGEKK